MSTQFPYLTKISKDKTHLIKGLQLIQRTEGYLSDDALKAAADYFSVSTAEVQGVTSFYTQFKRSRPGKYHIAVCDGTACHIKGSPKVLEWLATELNINDGETTEDGLFSIETVACLGCCSLAPVVSVNGEVFGKLDRKSTIKLLKDFGTKG